ncbi:MAG: hypothetical protein HFF25_08160 [Oscillospiraceae bacterium]|nr:hypothetical protein [Oscillospiraceae bacterium]MCI9551507.1 hypothetical protein [Oscillospiraceae bacterium]
MEICKDGAVKAIGTPGGEELALINALARRELGADEVYTFALRLCDNDVDRDFERFGDGTLDQLVPLFVGVSGVFDHQWSAKGQTARIYRTQVVEDGGALTADGRPCRYLKGWAYMMRTQENAALIAEIDGGIKREVSVGCAVDKVLCSICGRELDQCPHEKGEEYGGQVCHGVLTGAADVYEWSFVAVPAQRRAGVIKSAGRRVEDEARLGRKYLKSLRAELVRLAGIAEPGAGHALLERAAAKLDEEELVGLIKVCRGRTGRLFAQGPQLSYGDEAARPEDGCGAFLI